MYKILTTTIVLFGVVASLPASPAIARTARHLMMQPTAKYGKGFLSFTSKASDCMDLMVMAARSDSHDDRYYFKQYVGCLAGN